MKKYLPLPLIALLLFTTFTFIGCSAKKTAPTPATVDASSVQEPEERDESGTPEAELTDKSPSPEAEMADTPHSSEADAEDESHSPEAALEDKPRSPEQETHHETEPEETMPTVEIPSGSVLHLIPEHTLGIIYCPSLAELDNRINMLAMDLLPTAEPPEFLASILADTFGAGFESLAELEEIGLDLNQDFAIFTTSFDPPHLSATVHLTNPEAMKQVIAAESEGSAPTEYNGVTYWSATGADGNFALLENTLVFSQSAEVCESVIDTYNKTKPAVTTNPDYGTFLTDVSEGTAQLAVHFDLEAIMPRLSASLAGESEAMRDSLEADPSATAAVPFFENIFAKAISAFEHVKSLNATLEIEGTDLKLAPFLKFKNDSDIQNTLMEMAPHELARLGELPSRAFMNGAFQGKPELMLEMSMFWLKMFLQDSNPEHAEIFTAFFKQMEDFYAAIGEEWTFSASFSNSVMPDYLVIYELKDEQKAKAYMDESFLKQLHDSMEIVQSMMGDAVPNLDMYQDAHHGEPTTHNGVEIKSYVFPNFSAGFGEMPREAAGLIPKEWSWYYAFTDGYLLMAMGSPELLKMGLDKRAGTSTALSFSGEPSYEKLVTTLGLDSNLFFAISPITMVKSLLPIIAETADPNGAATMQMLSGMFMSLPENYSIGFSAKVQEGGIGAKLLLTLGDFKQVIQMIAMMQGMGQMQ